MLSVWRCLTVILSKSPLTCDDCLGHIMCIHGTPT